MTQAATAIAKAAPGIKAGIKPLPDVIALGARGTAYDVGLATQFLDGLLWVRAESIADHADAFGKAMDADLLIPALCLLRAIYELIGNIALITADVLDLAALEEPSDVIWVTRFNVSMALVKQRTLGTRIDWESLLGTPLAQGKKKSYKPAEDRLDLTADQLLDGVDLLDKQVRGVRKSYEFLSEFAHPNAGHYFVMRMRKAVIPAHSPFTFVETVLASQTPSDALQHLASRIGEAVAVAVKSIEYFEGIDAELQVANRNVKKRATKVIRHMIRNSSRVWTSKEPCPCLSGVEIGRCCGKTLVQA